MLDEVTGEAFAAMAAILSVPLGWVIQRQRVIDSRLELKADKTALERIASKLDKIDDSLTEHRVEVAEWRGEQKQKRS